MKEWMEVCFLSSDSAGIRAAVEEEEETFLKWPTHRGERGKGAGDDEGVLIRMHISGGRV